MCMYAPKHLNKLSCSWYEFAMPLLRPLNASDHPVDNNGQLQAARLLREKVEQLRLAGGHASAALGAAGARAGAALPAASTLRLRAARLQPLPHLHSIP